MSVTRQSSRSGARSISERRLPIHAERRRIDEDARLAKEARAVHPIPPAERLDQTGRRALRRDRSVRLTTWTGAKPRSRSAQMTARAAPPAPRITAGPGAPSQPVSAFVEIGEEADAIGRGGDQAVARRARWC